MPQDQTPKTLFDKLWEAHVVVPETADAPAVLYIDLHLIHEVTTPQAFAELESRGLTVRRPDLTKGTLDHSTPTTPAKTDGTHDYYTRTRRSRSRRCARTARSTASNCSTSAATIAASST